MASPRRKISKEERKQRDALMRVHNFVIVLVIRKLFDSGASNSDVAILFDRIQRETGRLCIAHAMPDWSYVDESQVAWEVFNSVTERGE